MKAKVIFSTFIIITPVISIISLITITLIVVKNGSQEYENKENIDSQIPDDNEVEYPLENYTYYENKDHKYFIYIPKDWNVTSEDNCNQLPWEGDQKCLFVKKNNFQFRIFSINNFKNIDDNQLQPFAILEGRYKNSYKHIPSKDGNEFLRFDRPERSDESNFINIIYSIPIENPNEVVIDQLIFANGYSPLIKNEILYTIDYILPDEIKVNTDINNYAEIQEMDKILGSIKFLDK